MKKNSAANLYVLCVTAMGWMPNDELTDDEECADDFRYGTGG
jgi:hypothetical protein